MYHTNGAMVQARSLKYMRFTMDCQGFICRCSVTIPGFGAFPKLAVFVISMDSR